MLERFKLFLGLKKRSKDKKQDLEKEIRKLRKQIETE